MVIHHFWHRTAHIEIDDVRPVFCHNLCPPGQFLRYRTEQLDGYRMLPGIHFQHGKGLGIPEQQRLGADHFRNRIIRPQLSADHPKRKIRNPGHRGKGNGELRLNREDSV